MAVAVPQSQVPGVYHRKVGDIVVTAISDGHLDGSMAVIQNIMDWVLSVRASVAR